MEGGRGLFVEVNEGGLIACYIPKSAQDSKILKELRKLNFNESPLLFSPFKVGPETLELRVLFLIFKEITKILKAVC